MNNTANQENAVGTINIVKNFITGGHAIFTVASPSGEHYTYTVSKPKDFNELSPIWFIGVLAGPDNHSDYRYLGIIRKDGVVALTAKSKFEVTSKAYSVAKWAVKVVWEGKTIPEGYSIRHSGKCGRCGRQLTHPESLDTGIGPICAGR